jgi:glyoxylase-like metal-dependent hydrolase (beta-lactamase superfamily II)
VFLRPFHRYESGCAAYVLGCATFARCAVVDPREEDLSAYVDFARSKGMRITHVLDTHVHADHRSGGRALAALAGARYCLHRAADVAFPFEPLDDDQELELGNTRLRVLHTPGHTPESVCLAVTDLRRGPEPWFLLTGDTLFVGAFEKRWNPALSLPEEEFVEAVGEGIPPRPPGLEAILRFNRGLSP